MNFPPVSGLRTCSLSQGPLWPGICCIANCVCSSILFARRLDSPCGCFVANRGHHLSSCLPTYLFSAESCLSTLISGNQETCVFLLFSDCWNDLGTSNLVPLRNWIEVEEALKDHLAQCLQSRNSRENLWLCLGRWKQGECSQPFPHSVTALTALCSGVPFQGFCIYGKTIPLELPRHKHLYLSGAGAPTRPHLVSKAESVQFVCI